MSESSTTDRVGCQVPGCGRTAKRDPARYGPYQESVCCKHWPLVPKNMRRAYARCQRRLGKLGHNEVLERVSVRLWRRCVRAAIERSVGIG